MKSLRNKRAIRIFILLCCLLPVNSLADKHTAVKSGDYFPNISLTGPLLLEDEKYFGLSTQKALSLRDIQAGFLLVEVFSIYCPVCQKHAAKFNKLYNLVQRDNFVGSNMKMIGIGTGNNSTEIAHFRKYFDVPFPLFPDPDFKVHAVLKKTRVPLVVIVDKRLLPYKILTILDFNKEAETLIGDIRAELHKIKKSSPGAKSKNISRNVPRDSTNRHPLFSKKIFPKVFF